MEGVEDLRGETGLVSILIDDGILIWDTLAITETLQEANPVIWPSDPDRRQPPSCLPSTGGMNHPISSWSLERFDWPIQASLSNSRYVRIVSRKSKADVDGAREGARSADLEVIDDGVGWGSVTRGRRTDIKPVSQVGDIELQPRAVVESDRLQR